MQTQTEQWFADLAQQNEGQLSVDILETEKDIIIQSAIAGTKPEDLDIHVTHDTVTIHGKRENGCKEYKNATEHISECFWGEFSRSIVLPAFVLPEGAKAELKNGILILTIPKTKRSSSIKVKEVE